MTLTDILETLKGYLSTYLDFNYSWLLGHLTWTTLKVAFVKLLHYVMAYKIWMIVLTIAIAVHIYKLTVLQYCKSFSLYLILWIAILSFDLFKFLELIMKVLLGGMIHVSGFLIYWCTDKLRDNLQAQLPRFGHWYFAIFSLPWITAWAWIKLIGEKAQGNAMKALLVSTGNAVLLSVKLIGAGIYLIAHGVEVLLYKIPVAAMLFIANGVTILIRKTILAIYLAWSALYKAADALVVRPMRWIIGKIAAIVWKITQKSEKVEAVETTLDTAKAELADIIDEIVEKKNDGTADPGAGPDVARPESDTTSDRSNNSSMFSRLLRRAEKDVVGIYRDLFQWKPKDDVEG